MLGVVSVSGFLDFWVCGEFDMWIEVYWGFAYLIYPNKNLGTLCLSKK
jgi:hypothetical protein